MKREPLAVLTDEERAARVAMLCARAYSIGEQDRLDTLPLNRERFLDSAQQAAYERGYTTTGATP